MDNEPRRRVNISPQGLPVLREFIIPRPNELCISSWKYPPITSLESNFVNNPIRVSLQEFLVKNLQVLKYFLKVNYNNCLLGYLSLLAKYSLLPKVNPNLNKRKPFKIMKLSKNNKLSGKLVNLN